MKSRYWIALGAAAGLALGGIGGEGTLGAGLALGTAIGVALSAVLGK